MKKLIALLLVVAPLFVQTAYAEVVADRGEPAGLVTPEVGC